MRSLARDLRFGLRLLRKSRVTGTVAISAIALGVGASTLVLSVADAVLVHPLPFADPARLVVIYTSLETQGKSSLRPIEPADFSALQRESRSLVSMAAIASTSRPLTGTDRPLNPLMRAVTADYFKVLGAAPRLGRTFDPEEGIRATKAVVLSHGFWQDIFGGSIDVLGKNLEIDHQSHEVIGVMPQGFRDPLYTAQPVLWLLLPDGERAPAGAGGGLRLGQVFARLAADLDLAQAQEEVDRISAELGLLRDERQGRTLVVLPLAQVVSEGYRPTVLILLYAVALVLSIACANVASLLVAHNIGRSQEVALRQALGSSRGRILRQLLTESLSVSVVGGAVGVLLAHRGLGILTLWISESFNIAALDSARIDLRALSATLVLCVGTGLAFGLPAAGQVLRRDCSELAGRALAPGRRGHLLRQFLVFGEVALSMVLIVGTVLLLRSLAHLRRVDPGVEMAGVLTLRTSASGAELDAPERWEEFYRRILEEIAALPGVVAAGAVSVPPMLVEDRLEPVFLVRHPDSAIPIESAAHVLTSTEGLFDALGIALVEGRSFGSVDRAETEGVAIVNRTMALRFSPNESAVGAVLRIGKPSGAPIRIVGVVDDVRSPGSAPDPRPMIYRPLAQSPHRTLSLIVRTSLAEPATATRSVEEAIWRVSSYSPVFNAVTLEKILYALDWQPRLILRLLGIFAVLALVLCCLGVYGVLSSLVAERSREFGLRAALGARRLDIVAMVLRRALIIGLAGIAVGWVIALQAWKWLRGILFGVSEIDPLTYACVAAGLLFIVLAASAVPALRAARVEPAVALRQR